MITLITEKNNTLTPNFYNSFISNLQFHQLKCPCGHAGGLSIHGYYHRYIKTSNGKIKFHICRVICEHCVKTHALLLSSMVPYSQLPLEDHVQIIEAFAISAKSEVAKTVPSSAVKTRSRTSLVYPLSIDLPPFMSHILYIIRDIITRLVDKSSQASATCGVRPPAA